VPRSHQVQSESDYMQACASPSGFAAPYHFSISPTCGFAFICLRLKTGSYNLYVAKLSATCGLYGYWNNTPQSTVFEHGNSFHNAMGEFPIIYVEPLSLLTLSRRLREIWFTHKPYI